jgi:5-methylcytosine-specific restriction protein A
MAKAPRLARPLWCVSTGDGGDSEYERRRRERLEWRRWYGTQRWRKRAKRQLMIEPLCRICAAEGVVRPASHADHIVPHRGDYQLFWCGELQSLCERCHNSLKQSQERRG